ncbi:DUF4362 domain-containing protein [Rossellomorea aquimaris]|uniref:DUF4362 domain-containing protein n=1 Tax=Rossellomorea aquimaris TaxID=189382 RepID=UPI0007D062C2|nr:DUF4362 domain-containing protein [Rossellomorea aquimaris]
MKQLWIIIFASCFVLWACEEETSSIDNKELLQDYNPISTDIVATHGEIENLDRFKEFFDHVSSGKPDWIRVVSYTEEGDAILQELDYDGETIQSKLDSRRDRFGSGVVERMSCMKLEYTQNTSRYDHVYELKECDNDEYNRTVIWY